MSYEGLGKRLIFWEGRNLISKFSCDIVPVVGQVWTVPKGEHKYYSEQGSETVEILAVEVHPLTPDSHIDIDILCRPTKIFHA